VNFVLYSRSTNYDGNDRLVYVADLENDSTSDLAGAWAQISGGVPANATVLDGILQFGATPASGSSQSTDGFIVIVPPGAAFDPTVVSWSVVPGVADQDQDGLDDGRELDYGFRTDPTNPDTDGDRFGDGVEIVMQADPLDNESVPVSFSDQVFYSTSPRADGKRAIALAGPNTFSPGELLLLRSLPVHPLK
jgi:hypothetical protein